MTSIYDNVEIKEALSPDVRSADADGIAVDTKGFHDGVCVFLADNLDTADGTETYTLEIEESDDGSTNWTNVSALDTTIVDGVTVVRLANLNTTRKRYIRPVLNVGGDSPSIEGGALILLGESEGGPVRS